MSRPKIVIKSKNNPKPSPEPEKVKEQVSNKEEQKSEPAENNSSAPSDISEELAPNTENSKTQDKTHGFPWGLVSGILAVILVLVAIVYYFFFYKNSDGKFSETSVSENTEEIDLNNNSIDFDTYDEKFSDYEKDILSKRTDFTELLEKVGMAGADINVLRKEADKKNIRNLGKGDKYSIYFDEDTPKLLVLEQKLNPYLKYEINFENLTIDQVQKVKDIKIMELAGIVETNLGVTFINNNFNLKLINRLEEIFEYSVDLFQVDDGDRFKILYEQEFLDGKPYEILKIRAAYIQEGGRDYYAFMNKTGNKIEYYNEFGESLKRSFLSSPIKYGGIISSGFGLRVHPIEGHTKMHLGTDYAAPEGTPIVSTADGVISIQGSTTNNGNYIKIRHDNTFETQYLHMQKFNLAFRQGSRVRQGDVIGYVGQTGLAKGPHVCYRFWKNKEQVDPKENAGNVSSRIPSQYLNKYMEYTKPLKNALKRIEYF